MPHSFHVYILYCSIRKLLCKVPLVSLWGDKCHFLQNKSILLEILLYICYNLNGGDSGERIRCFKRQAC